MDYPWQSIGDCRYSCDGTVLVVHGVPSRLNAHKLITIVNKVLLLMVYMKPAQSYENKNAPPS